MPYLLDLTGTFFLLNESQNFLRIEIKWEIETTLAPLEKSSHQRCKMQCHWHKRIAKGYNLLRVCANLF